MYPAIGSLVVLDPILPAPKGGPEKIGDRRSETDGPPPGKK